MTKPFEKKQYFALTLDPVHIGTGGYRLGRVDNTIVREPGTNLPKIPGSSIAGVTRAYTALAIQNVNYAPVVQGLEGWTIDYEKYCNWKYQRPDYSFMTANNSGDIKYASDGKAIILPNADGPMIKKKDGNDCYFSCAGKGIDDGDGHCGDPGCEVCVPFGFSKKESSFQGLAQFYDARILFFPIHSMRGPVWVTTPSILNQFIITECKVTKDKFKALSNVDCPEKLNFGWLMLERDISHTVAIDLSFITGRNVTDSISDKVFLVPDDIFSRIVNDNLEVRTSVAIDPATGTAEDGALYTYEAIPRATIMWFDVVYNKPEYFKIRQNGTDEKIKTGMSDGEGWKWLKENVEKGLCLFKDLGVGGMNTRGMGRVEILNIEGCDHGNS